MLPKRLIQLMSCGDMAGIESFYFQLSEETICLQVKYGVQISNSGQHVRVFGRMSFPG